ncbi:hypothetical protein COOONC_26872 [Cooperia oncophora]
MKRKYSGSLVMFPFDAINQRKVLYTPRRAEIDKVTVHPLDQTVQFVTEAYHKPELIVLNDTFKDDLHYLIQYGSIQSISMSLGPLTHCFVLMLLYGTGAVSILQAYLSLPPEAALRSAQDVPASDRNYANLGLLPVDPQKLIVSVHGGPNDRDSYGLSLENVFLTNRGYAVLQVTLS